MRVRPARYVDVDDGWHHERDVSVALGRWGWLDLRAFIEEHGGTENPAACHHSTPANFLRGIVLALSLTVALDRDRQRRDCAALAVAERGSVAVRRVRADPGALASGDLRSPSCGRRRCRATSGFGMIPMSVPVAVGRNAVPQPTLRNAAAGDPWPDRRSRWSQASSATGSSLAGDLVTSATAQPVSGRVGTQAPEPALERGRCAGRRAERRSVHVGRRAGRDPPLRYPFHSTCRLA